MVTCVVGRQINGTACKILTTADGEKHDVIKFEKASLLPGEPSWLNYVKGVMANFANNAVMPAFEAVIVSSVPIGGGLSSSAALEVSTYAFLLALTNPRNCNDIIQTQAQEIVKRCQKAEHEFAGMPCGIMDQTIAVLGKKDHALLLDCQSFDTKHIPFDISKHGLCVLVTNSQVKHKLTGSEYPSRRRMCEEASELFSVPSLRSVSVKNFEETKMEAFLANEEMRKRVRHVVGEIRRTEDAAWCLKLGDFENFGRLMNESHASLSEDYEVSCPEVDALVAAAQKVEGVLGSRMTGGGFGGCTVTLCKFDSLEDVCMAMRETAAGKSYPTPIFYKVSPADGAKVVDF